MAALFLLAEGRSFKDPSSLHGHGGDADQHGMSMPQHVALLKSLDVCGQVSEHGLPGVEGDTQHTRKVFHSVFEILDAKSTNYVATQTALLGDLHLKTHF